MPLLVITLIILITPSALAGEWENALTDFDMYEQQILQDALDSDMQIEDEMLENSAELFPLMEGDEQEVDVLKEMPTHLTIKVDGVPVILTDVPLNEWFAPYIRDVAERNLISGYRDAKGRPTGIFGPSDTVTIEQLAKIATLAARIDSFTCTANLKNVSAKGRWSERYVRCAEQLGWILFSEGTTDVTRPALRSEVVVTVLQALKVRIGPVSGTMFNDVTRATLYGNAIETASNNGIVSGYNDNAGNPTGYFGAGDSVNRAQAAKIFANAFSVYGK